MAINWDLAVEQAEKQHATAKDGKLKYDGQEYTFTFNRSCGVYSVEDEDGVEVIRLNTRKLATAKKDFKHWMEN